MRRSAECCVECEITCKALIAGHKRELRVSAGKATVPSPSRPLAAQARAKWWLALTLTGLHATRVKSLAE